VDLVFKLNKKSKEASKTKNFKIHHHPFSDYQAYKKYIAFLCEKYKASPVSDFDFEALVSNFGKDAELILSTIEPEHEGADPSSFKKRFVQSQLDYALKYESVAHPMDFINRRTGWSYFNIRMAKEYLPWVSDEISAQLNYTNEQKNQHLESSVLELDQDSLAFLKIPRA